MAGSLIKREWQLPFSLAGTIVDIETTALKPTDGEMITLGVFFSDRITVFQRSDISPEGKLIFEQQVKNWTDFCPKPYYAYNKDFEEAWLGTRIHHDLMAKWKTGAEKMRQKGDPAESFSRFGKWPKLSELVSFPQKYFGIEDIEGREVPLLWKEYKTTGDKAKLTSIVNHNLCNLVSAACLYMWDEVTPKLLEQIDETIGKGEEYGKFASAENRS